MKNRALAALAMPLVAAVATGGLLVVSHRTAFPSLTQAGLARSSQPVAPSRCEPRTAPTPFTGIAINPRITAHVQSFTKTTGAHVSVVEFYNAFDQPFQRWEAQQATALGALPLIQLNPRHTPLAKIAAGRYDLRISQYADAVKAFRCPVVLSFGHEMNGWWYPWGRPWTTPATYIAAWRHIHDVFAAKHVTNVIWSWDPSHQYRHKDASLASEWFPGAAYVDWIGVDGYLGPGQTFADVFARQLRDIRGMTSKPIYLAETGVAGGPGQGWQIASVFASVRKFHLSGLIWFDLNRKRPWRLEGRPAAVAAYRKALASLAGSRPAAGTKG